MPTGREEIRMSYKYNEATISSLEDYLLNELFQKFISHNGGVIFEDEHMHKTINWYSEYVGSHLHQMYGIEQKGE